MSKNTGLGKGFEGLIPSGFDIKSAASPGEQIRSLLISDISANPDQPRKSFDEASLKELADSIVAHGIIQPLIVTPDGEKYRLVAGERRLRASKIAGIHKVPVIVRNHKELEELEVSIVENVQRVDLSPIETAVSLVRLRDQFSMSPKDIAKKLGKAETTVSNIIRLLQLPKEALEALQNNDITEGHARALLSLKTDEKSQKQLLNNIITQKLSVRETETQAKLMKKASSDEEYVPKRLKTVFSSLKKTYGKRLRLQQKKRGGRLSLDYESESELQDILRKLQ